MSRGNSDDVCIRMADVEFRHAVPASLGSLDDIGGGDPIPHGIGVEAAEVDGSEWRGGVVESEHGELRGRARAGWSMSRTSPRSNIAKYAPSVSPDHPTSHAGDTVVVNVIPMVWP